jgi:hypothetical protein
MANTLLTPLVYAKSALALLKNNLVMGRLVDSSLTKMFNQVGDTVYVKRDVQFAIRSGAQAQMQDVVEGRVPVTIDKQKGIDIKFTDLQEALSVTDLLRSNIMASKAAQLAQEIDNDLAQTTLEFPSWVGTPGNLIDSPSDFNLGMTRLNNLAVPMNDRSAILSPNDYGAMVAFFTTPAFNDNETNLTALRRAKLPMLMGADAYMTQNVPIFTTGTRVASGAAQVDGANQGVTYNAVANTYQQTLNIKGLTNGQTIKKGDIFSIVSGTAVNWVNPRSKINTGIAAQFVVLADVTVVGTQATIQIANPIITSGAYQTVTAAPDDSAQITWVGVANTSYSRNSQFVGDAIKLVWAKPVMPFSGQTAFASDPESGITIRYWRESDIINDEHLHRWDVIYGVKNADRRMGTSISGT